LATGQTYVCFVTYARGDVVLCGDDVLKYSSVHDAEDDACDLKTNHGSAQNTAMQVTCAGKSVQTLKFLEARNLKRDELHVVK